MFIIIRGRRTLLPLFFINVMKGIKSLTSNETPFYAKHFSKYLNYFLLCPGLRSMRGKYEGYICFRTVSSLVRPSVPLRLVVWSSQFLVKLMSLNDETKHKLLSTYYCLKVKVFKKYNVQKIYENKKKLWVNLKYFIMWSLNLYTKKECMRIQTKYFTALRKVCLS